MGPWCAPWLLLTLPDVLWGQTQSSQPAQPGMQSFQGDQVRGLPGREAAGWGRSLGGEEAVQAGVAAQGVQQVSSGCQGPRPCLQGPGTSAQARTERDPGRTFLGLPFPPAPLAHAAAEAQGGQTSAPGPGPAPLPREGSWLRPCRAGGRGSRPHQQPLQFQGEWFVLGLASNTFGKEHKALLVPFTTTFELTAQGHFTVSNAMTRGPRCDTWSYVMIPEAQPGQFVVDHSRGPGSDREEIRVVDSDYTSFALLLSRRPAGSLTVVRVSLLGRNWMLPPGTIDKFICLGRTQGFSKNNVVFPDLAGWLPEAGTC
ncbi:epididymal-specific lipocalin-12 isoform X2 [Eulemur rufifrons]|uniref:epididymal-specific lipocalin-12 isoform X2 n=1 Tax=Eulemur rufifrons TaxID=859984 RepID=UPI003741E9DE